MEIEEIKEEPQEMTVEKLKPKQVNNLKKIKMTFEKKLSAFPCYQSISFFQSLIARPTTESRYLITKNLDILVKKELD